MAQALFMRHAFARSSFLFGMLACLGQEGSFAAEGNSPWKVAGKLLGKDGKKAKDVSGIACAQESKFPRVCLVIDDEVRAAQFVVLDDGQLDVGQQVQLVDNSALELDGEAAAYSDGYFYVIGSHGHPRDKNRKLDPARDASLVKARIEASTKIIRFPVDPKTSLPAFSSNGGSPAKEVVSTSRLREILLSDEVVRPFVDKRLEKASNGLTIEGVAVAGGRLYAGLRGPSLEDKQAAIVSASLDGLFSDKALDPKRHLIAVGQGRGIRDLVPYGKGMLVLAGPTPNDAEGDAAIYSVFYWDTVSSLPVPLGDLSMFEEGGDQIKPEALVPLGETESGLRILILFDGAKEGAPRDLLVKKP